MKKKLIYTLSIVSLLMVGCGEDFLDPVRDNKTLTSEQVLALAEDNPAIVQGGLDGLYNYLIQPRSVTGSQHYDFGQKGIDIWLDIVSGDMALSGNVYGWYQSTANLTTTVDYTRTENRIIWTYLYKTVSTSNELIDQLGGNDASPETTEARHIYAQARAIRGYAYLNLAQIFQRAYDPGQPILPYYDGESNNPAKVPASEIYALIENDLTTAISMLDDFSRNSKDKINKSVAQGLLAYAYAAQGKYAQAKEVSDEIILTGGFPLTTTGQLAYPGAGSGFNDVSTPSWMWGYDLTEDLGHQLIDWWGQMDLFTYSYPSAGDTKAIDNLLYSQIPANDIRKTQFSTAAAANLMPINKFFDPGRAVGGQYIITTDLIFMRIEEFYLLSAEAAAQIGDETAAKARLIEMLSNRMGGQAAAEAYVNPLSGQALKDAIYLQTRIELWGEGKTYFAMKRNKATVTRGTNHLFLAGQSFSYDSDEMSFQIPMSEILNNPSITSQN